VDYLPGRAAKGATPVIRTKRSRGKHFCLPLLSFIKNQPQFIHIIK
jgi:hypothetical protein